MRARHRGAVSDPRLANVTALSRSDIESMNQQWGVMETANAIAQAAVVQLANVRVCVGLDDHLPALGRERDFADKQRDAENGPSMYSRLAEIDAAPELTALDKQQIKSDTIRRHGLPQHARDALRYEARVKLLQQIAEIVGDERASRVARLQEWDRRAERFAMPWFDALLRVPKHERRKALARALEELEDNA